MKHLLTLLALFFVTATAQAQIEWLTWEEAMARNEKEPKKVLVDVYTDWCGWCKKMDKTTFVDPAIVSYVMENFYAVKFNAEQKADINYKGHTLKFNANTGRRGAHDLAVALLDGRLSFPSIVYLDETGNRISVSPGFKKADTYVNELAFIGGGHYANQSYQEFLAGKR